MSISDWFYVAFSVTVIVAVIVNTRTARRIERAIKAIRESNEETMTSNLRVCEALAVNSALVRGAQRGRLYPSAGGQA